MNNTEALCATCLAVTVAVCAQAEEKLDVTAGWRFAPDPHDVGVGQKWHAPAYSDEKWVGVNAGVPWTAQGFEEHDGHAWYRKTVRIPADWAERKIWLVLGGVANTMTLYIDGREVAPYGNFGRSVGGPALAELSSRCKAGTDTHIAMRFKGGGQRAGLFRGRSFLTTDPADVPLIVKPDCFVAYADKLATVRATMRGMGRGAVRGTVDIKLLTPDRSDVLAQRRIPIPQYYMDALCTLPIPHEREPRTYPVLIVFHDEHGDEIPGTKCETVARWPGDLVPPPAYDGVRVLNNLVAELGNAKCPADGRVRVAFTNPRDGWVFFRVTAGEGETKAEMKVHLDGSSEPLVLRAYPFTRDLEAMRRLPRGDHTLEVANAPGRRVIVRAIPELGFCYYPAGPKIAEYNHTGSGKYYPQAFMDRYILPNLNMLVANSTDIPEAMFRQWRAEGRRWVARSHIFDPTGSGGKKPPPWDYAQKLYEHWAESPGVTNPDYHGLIVDEFWARYPRPYYDAWLRALHLLQADLRFEGKTFYAFCAIMGGYEPAREVQRFLVEHDHRFAYEQYLLGVRSLDQQRCYLGRRYVREIRDWKRHCPELPGRLQMCPTFASMPSGTFDTDPSINFNVSMDMQLRAMATEPGLFGLASVSQWYAQATDEETLRLFHRMLRHYGIDGETRPYLDDPFESGHVENPDFEFGLKGWQPEAADGGSITTRYIEGFSLVPGRYWRTYKGDTFASMKRSAKGPNRLRQTIRNLEPGRTYSLKLYTTDLQNIEVEQKLGVTVGLDDVDSVDDVSFHVVYRSGMFREARGLEHHKQAFGNMHRIVFRAKGKTAMLTISDWASEKEPGGRDNQELTCNFVAVRPYYPAR